MTEDAGLFSGTGAMPEELEQLKDAALPVETIEEALPHLRRPFTAEAVKWKIQSIMGREVLIVAHIDARLVIERLNAVVGGGWQEGEVRAHGQMLGQSLTVLGQTHYDVGSGSDAKALMSDVLKRVAVRFGIGVSVYALPRVYWPKAEAQSDGRIRVWTNSKGKEVGEITPVGMRALSGWLPRDGDAGSGYALWLANVGERRFGPVLDHGDVFDAGGIEDVVPVPTLADEDAPAVPEVAQLDSREAEALRGQIRLAYDGLKARRPQALMPAVFAQKLAAAGGSLEELQALLEEISALAREATK